MDYSALNDELSADPLGLGYASLVAARDTKALAALLARPDRDGWRETDAGTIAGVCELTLWDEADSSQGYIFEHLEALKAANAGDGSVIAGKLLRMVSGASAASSFQMQDAAKRAGILTMLDALALAGMSQAAKAAILAPAQGKVSRAVELGLSNPTPGEIATALWG